MEKKKLTMNQKYRIFNIGRIISYTVLVFSFLMDGFQSPLTWISLIAAIGVSVFRVMALRCPECDELIVSNFGIISKSCAKCGWKLGQEEEPKEETQA